MRVRKDNTLGLIIDMQSKLFPFINDNEGLIRRSTILVKGLQYLDIPLIITQQYTKGLGETIDSLKEALGVFKPVEKNAFSCYDEPVVAEKLALESRKNIIIAGIEAHVCVLQTVVDLIRNAYIPVVVEDCISSRKVNDKNMAVQRMRQEGAIITTYESILFELLRYSNVEPFRDISNLVK